MLKVYILKKLVLLTCIILFTTTIMYSQDRRSEGTFKKDMVLCNGVGLSGVQGKYTIVKAGPIYYFNINVGWEFSHGLDGNHLDEGFVFLIKVVSKKDNRNFAWVKLNSSSSELDGTLTLAADHDWDDLFCGFDLKNGRSTGCMSTSRAKDFIGQGLKVTDISLVKED